MWSGGRGILRLKMAACRFEEFARTAGFMRLGAGKVGTARHGPWPAWQTTEDGQRACCGRARAADEPSWGAGLGGRPRRWWLRGFGGGDKRAEEADGVGLWREVRLGGWRAARRRASLGQAWLTFPGKIGNGAARVGVQALGGGAGWVVGN
jgi:hypothetical protein